MSTPSHGQLIALRTFAFQHGPAWKAILRHRWERGEDVHEKYGAILREIRNQLGPRRLKRFKLTKACEGLR